MKKIILFFLITIFSLVSCESSSSANINVLETPKNNRLLIKGTWEVTTEKLAVEKDIESKIYFDISNAYIDGQNYSDVHYKLKVVNSDYIISYEHDIKLKDYIGNDKSTDVYSILSKDRLVCELFLINEDNAILSYNQNIVLVRKLSGEIIHKIDPIENENNTEHNKEVDSATGVMVALKSTINNKKTYRTLWIPYYENNLGTIYELPNIIFPRRDGIYKIEPYTEVKNGYNLDNFRLIAPDKKIINNEVIDEQSNKFRSITYLCNDYIGIEETRVDNHNTVKTYKVLPVKNLNSDYGVTIEELYGYDIVHQLPVKNLNSDYGVTIEELYGYHIVHQFNKEIMKYDDNNIDYSNFTLFRDRGKWKIYSLLEGKDKLELSIKPNYKLLTYDTLSIPWKNLKSQFPLMKDAFISPIQDIAIIVLEDSIGVYKINNAVISDSPLFNIEINSNEEVIMAEWCSGFYTEIWEKSFLAGKALN